METLTSVSIQPLLEAHYSRVKAIYEQGILTQNATLETSAPDWEKWNTGHLSHSRLIISTPDEEVAGWAALSPVSGRCVYGGVAEVSVYIDEEQRGKGLGKVLLQELITSSETHGIWTLQAGILKENEGSVALHQKCGFRIVGLRERLGQLRGQWRDTFLLERRSAIVGV
ncbi:GNAT family N-acetyltransferase [Rufibacter tibetensis]|uniref:Phosphinothricin acetyltransferase n=1 Tax=Rufibacter tibetensis TaxID=512763 RepID=A0A0N7HWN5_9BACT|nr:GNAT family N-acetyltransferase [Rufibacter tibetensis]ALI99744.1 phosphinothricin acetyltransferase [Rufibacter tibetensis]